MKSRKKISAVVFAIVIGMLSSTALCGAEVGAADEAGAPIDMTPA